MLEFLVNEYLFEYYFDVKVFYHNQKLTLNKDVEYFFHNIEIYQVIFIFIYQVAFYFNTFSYKNFLKKFSFIFLLENEQDERYRCFFDYFFVHNLLENDLIRKDKLHLNVFVKAFFFMVFDYSFCL